MTFDARNKFGNLFHNELRVLGQLGVMCNGATILYTDTIAHQVIHVQDQVKKRRLKVRR